MTYEEFKQRYTYNPLSDKLGEGVYYDASGNTVYKGQWKNGEIKEQ
jgi:hypothetical protein